MASYRGIYCYSWVPRNNNIYFIFPALGTITTPYKIIQVIIKCGIATATNEIVLQNICSADNVTLLAKSADQIIKISFLFSKLINIFKASVGIFINNFICKIGDINSTGHFQFTSIMPHWHIYRYFVQNFGQLPGKCTTDIWKLNYFIYNNKT